MNDAAGILQRPGLAFPYAANPAEEPKESLMTALDFILLCPR